MNIDQSMEMFQNKHIIKTTPIIVGLRVHICNEYIIYIQQVYKG